MTEASRVTVENTGEAYDCPADTILLDAGLAAGLHMPHNCRGGACGTCKAELLEGEVDHGWVMSFAISDEEKAAGMCLACQSKPRAPHIRLRMINDMTLRGAGEETIVPAEFQAEIVAAHNVTPAVRRLVVALPRGVLFRFHAGQSIEFLLPGFGQPRPYSVAHAPDADGGAPDGQLAFFITRHPQGAASGWIHTEAAVGATIALRGPYGAFHLPPGDGPILALAGSTGLSPILSLVQQAVRDGCTAPSELILSVRDRAETFGIDALSALARRHPDFRFRVTLTRDPAATAPWLQGRVPALLAGDAQNLANTRILIAGAPAFVDDCTKAVIALGAPPRQVCTDSFLPRGPALTPAG